MKRFLSLSWIAFAGCLAVSCVETGRKPVAGDAMVQSPRETLAFDQDWRFARFGLQADGSRIDEPGMAKSRFQLSASSEETGKGNIAALAMDGDPATRWCASSAAGGQWIQIDLGAASAVAKADIAWESDGNYQAVIEGSADGNEWKSLPATIRFVRIKITAVPAGRWASICEIRLTGTDGQTLANRLQNTAATPADPAFADAAWRKLDLPHDWAIEGPFRFDLEGNTGKLPWQGISW
jgi:beta-galactosidase